MGHAVTQQLGANHTCAHIGAALSRAHRGHLGTQPATPVLLLTLSPSCKSLWNTPPQMEHHTVQDARSKGSRCIGCSSFKVRPRGFSTLCNSSAYTEVPLILSIPFPLISSANALRQETESEVAPSVWIKARFGTGLGKKAAYERLFRHDSK